MSGLIYWIMLNLSQRSPQASTGCCLGPKSLRSFSLKTLFSTLRRFVYISGFVAW